MRRRCPGRSTLTATSAPSPVRAKCTWAIDAAATRLVVERREQRCRAARPNSASIRRAASPRERREPVLQPRQIGGDFLAHKIGAGRQDLTELDKTRADPPERRRRAARPGARSAVPRRRRTRKSRSNGPRHPRERKERVVPRQDHADADEPREVAEVAKQRA